jgi:pimeloyl-ACP methyl ester carboxylesterase/predicted MPP superfamily phosphohydrolase
MSFNITIKKEKFCSAALILLLVFGFAFVFIPTIKTTQAAVDPNSFSIMQISDTQFLSASFPQLFKDTTNWIGNNAGSYNLKMVIHTGDLVDNINGTTGTYSDPVQWATANASMSLLLNAGIPYCWDAGNHDQIPWNDANGTWLGSSYAALNATNMRSKPYWVSDAVDSKNTATQFSYNGYRFLIINLEYMASNSTISWMKTLLDNNKGANVIIAAHTYLNKADGYGFASAGLPGEVAWCTNLKAVLDGYPNVFLTLSGHDPTGTANMTRVGNREEIFFNRQSATTAAGQTGAAAVRIYTFNLTSKQVSTTTYSLDTQTWLTTAANQFSFSVASLKSDPQFDWVLVNASRSLKAYPALQESIWQKNATMTPNGQYDKIGLHRIVNPSISSKGVIFINPGTYLSGEELTSNPPTDNFTKTENNSQAIYCAIRGYDVYAIDYRTHFVPATLNTSQLGFMANWGWDQWISDIKEAVNKAKDISGASKLFMAGQSFGGRATMNYAALYGQQDLRGIILLDGGNGTKNTNPTNTYNLTAVLSQENATASWALIMPNLPGRTPVAPTFQSLVQYCFANPGAPAQFPPGTPVSPTINPATNKTWTNITEWISTILTGATSNIAAGYMNVTTVLQAYATMDRYWPDRLNLEFNAYGDWTNCPYVTNDYDEQYASIGLPLIGFTSQLFGLDRSGLIGYIGSPDTTTTLLLNYGHMDVFMGTYSARDISEPVYRWMLNHYQPPSASAFCSVTVVTGQTWYFFAHSAGSVGPITYQWYESTTLLTGQTSMLLQITKTTAGTYTYSCKVTDAEGTTATTNPITLTVISK